ncbi:MAG: glycosyltransferase family 9 protein [Planctomycetes bacterium]|nr:glycosyltransferase family 9 protein [Planctomycetota bacterium]
MTAVLLVRLSAMGDVVQGLGAVAALHRARPDWRLEFVTQEPFVPLLQGFPGLARLVPFGRRGGLAAVWAVRRQLRAGGYDVALDLQGNWKSAMIARLAGAGQTIGVGKPWRQEPASRCLLGRVLAPPAGVAPHPARVAWELVRALVPEVSFAWPQLSPTAAEVAHEAAALRALGVDPQRPFAVVVITDPADPRALRPEVVAAWQQAQELPVVHLLGPAEAALPARQPATLRHEAGAVRRLLALGALVAAAGGLVLGPDQGASHVLAAAGARCTLQFGAQDPRRTAPPAAEALVHPQPPACQPCRARSCSHPSGPVCMQFAPGSGRRVDLGLPPAAGS